jgi:hypothetical protein
MTASFDPVWGWSWTLLAALASLAVVMSTYRRRLASMTAPARSVLIGLRLATWSLVVFALLRPELLVIQTDPGSARIVVLTDKSRSMTVRDGPGGSSRRDWMLQTVTDIAPQLRKAEREAEIQYFEFGEDLTAVESPGGEGDALQTALGHALDDLSRQATTRRLLRIFLLSDGAQRALPPREIEPRGVALRLAEQNIRIDTVCFGSTGVTENSLDVIVEDLQVSPTVFVKNTVVVAAKVRVLGGAGREVMVRLKLESPQVAVQGGEQMLPVGVPLRLAPNRNDEVFPVELNFVAENPGEFRLTLEAPPLEEEALRSNNSASTYLTVLKGGLSVAYFDVERGEQRLLRRIDESPHIRLDFKPIRLLPGLQTAPVEATWFEPGKYDVYIIGGVPARAFDPAGLKRLAQLVQQGGGLLMTGGTYSFGPGGYAATPLADVLPIEMLATETQFAETIDVGLYHAQSLAMRPTDRGLMHYVMRLDEPSRNLDRWQALPALSGGNRFAALKPGALVLAQSEDQVPLLVAQDVGKGRAMAFAGFTSFYWYQAGFPEAHQRFWEQVILWLAHKENQSDQAVWLNLEGRRFRKGQQVNMTMGARDPITGPLQDVDFTVEVAGPGGKRFPLAPQRGPAETLARFTETAEPGEYRVVVDARRDGAILGLGASSRFLVEDQDLELHNPAADPGLLAELSRTTAGAAVTPEEFPDYLERLLADSLNIDVTRERRTPLWDNGWVLAIFSGLLATEWWLRKKLGMV